MEENIAAENELMHEQHSLLYVFGQGMGRQGWRSVLELCFNSVNLTKLCIGSNC